MQDFYEPLGKRQHAQALQYALEQQAQAMETLEASTRAALVQLEAQVINASCHNPGLLVTNELFLSMVRERLLNKVLEMKEAAAQPEAQVCTTFATLCCPALYILCVAACVHGAEFARCDVPVLDNQAFKTCRLILCCGFDIDHACCSVISAENIPVRLCEMQQVCL